MIMRPSLAVWTASLLACAGFLCPPQARGEDTLAGTFAEKVAATPKRGFLYRVVPARLDESKPAQDDPPGACLYLYGTIHVGKASLFPLNPVVAQSLSASSRLALEADPTKQSEVARLVGELALYPESDSLTNHIPSDLLARLPAIGARYHLPMARMLRMRAWMLAQSLDVLELERAGLTSSEGVEVILAQYALQRHIPVVEIEGFEEQLHLLSGEPPLVQVDELRESIEEIQTGRAARDAQDLLEGWANSDERAVEAALSELSEEDGAYAHFMVDDMLYARNRTMADRAETYCREGGTTFFAVGSLHLFSHAGLVAELTRRGYRVENLQ
jgi:uncharacterized protein YbaP (TraB family)